MRIVMVVLVGVIIWAIARSKAPADYGSDEDVEAAAS